MNFPRALRDNGDIFRNKRDTLGPKGLPPGGKLLEGIYLSVKRESGRNRSLSLNGAQSACAARET